MKTAVRSLLLAIFLIGSSSFIQEGRWLITPNSNLVIHGSTNINTFQCAFNAYSVQDTLEYNRQNKSIIMKGAKSVMRIPIKSFDCGKKQITKDFQEALQVTKYPNLEICFRAFTKSVITDQTYVDGIVDITLAGKTRRYTIHYFADVPNTESISLTGVQAVNFSDFDLAPPKKMMGMIQVQEDLKVEFDLVLKEI